MSYIYPGTKKRLPKPSGDRQWAESRPVGVTERNPAFTPEIAAVVSFDGLRDFIRRERAASTARGDKLPTPFLGQAANRPPDRRRLGPAIVGAVIAMAGTARPGEGHPTEHNQAMERGHAIFARLDSIRIGPEKIVDREAQEQIHEQAAGIQATPVLIGRFIVARIEEESGQHGALGAAREALAALELEALAEQEQGQAA